MWGGIYLVVLDSNIPENTDIYLWSRSARRHECRLQTVREGTARTGPEAAGVDTADADDATAQKLVNDLIDADVVTPVPEDQVLVHEPSGTTFDSTTQLAVFHRGWTAGRDADVESD